MKLECEVKGLTTKRSGFVVLLLNDVMRLLLDGLNELVRLKSFSNPPFILVDMYRYVSVLLMLHKTGLSFEKSGSMGVC